METKTFKIITLISGLITITAAVLAIIGITVTGLYPAIFVLILLPMIPAGSRFYVKWTSNKLKGIEWNFNVALIIANLFTILIAIWMSFVILVDRVFSKVL